MIFFWFEHTQSTTICKQWNPLQCERIHLIWWNLGKKWVKFGASCWVLAFGQRKKERKIFKFNAIFLQNFGITRLLNMCTHVIVCFFDFFRDLITDSTNTQLALTQKIEGSTFFGQIQIYSVDREKKFNFMKNA